jgi:hypothetical protein
VKKEEKPCFTEFDAGFDMNHAPAVGQEMIDVPQEVSEYLNPATSSGLERLQAVDLAEYVVDEVA